MNTDRSVKVKDIVEKFQMEVLYPGADFETETLTITDVNRPGLQLVGFFDYFDPRRLQIIGKAETMFLKSFSSAERRKCFEDLFKYEIPALVISRKLDVFPECMEMAQKVRPHPAAHGAHLGRVYEHDHRLPQPRAGSHDHAPRRADGRVRRGRADPRRQRHRQERDGHRADQARPPACCGRRGGDPPHRRYAHRHRARAHPSLSSRCAASAWWTCRSSLA